ncbi:hypothetical protein K2173_025016 [Erythroxylum novogranatense]|uniref:Uncharacterized protein n=1 Tax=Erythroxylum novogranatense TaxID=1862640 RepID=A0AAV8UFV3_9ROSI|nr:hypothetical protein K2173_025016 [Erythroxylum novogranatense]
MNNYTDQSVETTCGFLLLELQVLSVSVLFSLRLCDVFMCLVFREFRYDVNCCWNQKIWDEVGEIDIQRDKMLFEIEQECLEIYRRRVDDARRCKSELEQSIELAKNEIEKIHCALGEETSNDVEHVSRSLKEEFSRVVPRLEEMRKRKAERRKQFVDVAERLESIWTEIFGSARDSPYKMAVDENDLSSEKLEELDQNLEELQQEKNNRLKEISSYLDTIKSLCVVLGIDFKHTIRKIHPTLDDSGIKDIRDDTMKMLIVVIQRLKEVKIQRMHKLQDLVTVMLELWKLMDTPVQEQQRFQTLVSYSAASEPEINKYNILSADMIKQVEEEVARLEQLKSSKVKELVLKRRVELENMCRKTHIATEALIRAKYSIEELESKPLDPMLMLERIEFEIAEVKAEIFSRKEVLEKVEKWLAACEEERWLEEYNSDENRYNAGRGAHLILKRAERARAMVNKIPAMVEALSSKIRTWEKERGNPFLYDGEQLLVRLEEYSKIRRAKEQARLKQRDQKRLQVQMIAEQEALFGSKPSPCGNKISRISTVAANDRKLSLGGAVLRNLKVEKSTPQVKLDRKVDLLKNNQLHGGFTSQSSGRRNSETADHLAKKKFSTAVKALKKEPHLIRKPLSPVPLTVSSQANVAKCLEDQKNAVIGKSGTRVSCNKSPYRTPERPITVLDEENRTPKTLPFLVPKTPSTVSAPMLMVTTPATPYVSSSTKIVKTIMEQVEYSFEELRAGFVCAS